MPALKRICSTYLGLINDSPTKRRVLRQSHVTHEKYNEKQECFLTSNNVPFISSNSLFLLRMKESMTNVNSFPNSFLYLQNDFTINPEVFPPFTEPSKHYFYENWGWVYICNCTKSIHAFLTNTVFSMHSNFSY